jgi:diguanylate cyclase
LTQVLNRRGLEEVFAIEQSRARRDGAALAVAMLDIDNFKNLNDSLGHQAGDMALKHLCAMVRNAVRPSDTVARYGGEEFVILLPGTLSAEAADILTRVQRQLTRAFFLHNAERVLMTFSAGAAECAPGEDLEAVIRRADGALLSAKAAGKNRVHTA